MEGKPEFWDPENMSLFPWIAGYPFNRGNRYNDYANILLRPHLGILFSLNGAGSLE